MSVNISVNGVAYPVPSSAADTNWAAQQVRFQQALAAYVNSLAGGALGVVAQISEANSAADNRTALEDAITECQADGTYTVLWPPTGRCSFDLSVITPGNDNDRLITVPSGVTIRGVGRASVAYLTGITGDQDGDVGRNFLQFEADADGSVIEGVRFVGENGIGDAGFTYVDQNQSSCVSFRGDNSQTNCVVRGCWFENIYGFSVHSAGTVRYCQILDCFMWWCANGINMNGYGTQQSRNQLYKSEGFECDGSDNMFSENQLTDCYVCGFSVGGDQSLFPPNIFHGNSVVGNNINGVSTPGGQGAGIVFSDAICYGLIQGNTIRRCTGTSITAASQSLVGTEAYGHLIVGNVVINGSNGFPNVYGVNLKGAGKHHVIGNTIRNVPPQTSNGDETGLAFQLGLVVDSNDNYIAHNVLGGGSAGGNYAVAFSSGLTGNVLGPNTYVDSPLAVAWNVGSTQSPQQLVAATSGQELQRMLVGIDSQPMFIDYASGKRSWGLGGATPTDVDLERSAVGRLQITGALDVTTGMGSPNLDGTVPAGAGITVAAPASALTSSVHKVTVTFAAPAAGSGATHDTTIWTIPARTKVLRVIADITANFTGAPISAATLKVGKTVGGDEYLLAGDCLTAPVTFGAVLAEEGASLSAGVGDIPSWSAATAIKARWTATGGNVSSFTAGSVTFYIETCTYQ